MYGASISGVGQTWWPVVDHEERQVSSLFREMEVVKKDEPLPLASMDCIQRGSMPVSFHSSRILSGGTRELIGQYADHTEISEGHAPL